MDITLNYHKYNTVKIAAKPTIREDLVRLLRLYGAVHIQPRVIYFTLRNSHDTFEERYLGLLYIFADQGWTAQLVKDQTVLVGVNYATVR